MRNSKTVNNIPCTNVFLRYPLCDSERTMAISGHLGEGTEKDDLANLAP